MPTFQRLEDILAWQKARELVGEVYAVSSRGAFAKDFALRDQTRRAAISVAANIAEGFGRGGSVEFAQFLAIAEGSLSELRSHLYLALDQDYLAKEEFAALTRTVGAVDGLVGGLLAYLRHSEVKGVRYRRSPTRET